jgi:hypothetical protein
MKYVLVKYKGIKLLINEGLHMQPLLDSLQEIEVLAEKVNNFYQNIINKKKEDGKKLEDEKSVLISKIGYKIIGVPFSNHDAELFALDKSLDYEILELHGNTGKTNASKSDSKNSHVHMRVTQEQKSAWVNQAQSQNLKLAEWITKKLNGEL